MTTAISIVLALLFTATAAAKLTGQTASLAMRDHLQIPAVRWRQIGVLELAGVAGVLIGLALRPLGIAAAGGLVLLALGAIATHVRAGDKPVSVAPAVVALALALATVALQAANA
jgi:DoxX-like family